MNKILIHTDKNKIAEFQRDVENVLNQCQELINQFHQFQNWKGIKTEEDFIQLIEDPAEYFDQVLINNTELKSTGNLRPNPEMVAKMFNIDRESWQNLVAGKPISEGCEPCRKMKIRKGSKAITLSEYQHYQDYLILNAGWFILNEETILRHKETFKIFAENKIQVNYYNHYLNLAKILNEEIAIGKLGTDAINQLAKITDLQILNNTLVLNEFKLSETIKYL